jgi:hypothetical protein
MRALSSICIFVLLSISGLTQEKIEVTVLDIQTEEPIAFAKIGDGETEPVLTDIDGKASVDVYPNRTYRFSFYDYVDTTHSGNELINSPIVYMLPDLQLMDEVVITPGENPAHRIIKNAMDKRKENDPMRNNSFRYDSYSKFYLTGETTEPINRDTLTDSATIRALNLLDEQYIFLTETAATRTFSPPNYDKEIVNSYNVSGVKDPMFATLVNQFQSFSFYDNVFTINQQDFINPIAPGSLRRYLFILEDTLIHENNDTTFTIKYRPRKGKNFEGLEGYLFVTTNNWALEKVIASPYEQNGMFETKVIQSYRFTNNKKWFPHKLSTEFKFNGISLGKYSEAIGRSNLYIKEVEFDVDVDKKFFNPVQIEVGEDAKEDSIKLNAARGSKSTDKETKTYHVIDSVSEANNLDKMLEVLKIASTGKIPLGKLSIPLQRIIDFNQQEGYRLGAGLETNRRFSKWFGVGGYFAYGFRDKEWKWGGDMNFTFHQKRDIGMQLHYSEDLLERGGTLFNNDQFNLMDQSLYRDFFINRLDRQRKAEISFSGLIRQNFKASIFGNYKRLWFTDDYAYIPLFDPNVTSTSFDVAETGLEITWNIREKIMLLDDQRVSLGTKFPRINLKLAKGWRGIEASQYEYYRMNLTVDQDFSIRGFGELKLSSKSGMTVGNVPLSLHQVQLGTGKSWNLTVANTFETMQPAEFFSDRQTSLFMRFSFLPIKNIADFTQPKFVIHSAAGVGSMDNVGEHVNYDFKVPEKGYYESGLIIEDLLISGFNGFGVGAFYRYGPYSFAETADNFVYKLSITFNL